VAVSEGWRVPREICLTMEVEDSESMVMVLATTRKTRKKIKGEEKRSETAVQTRRGRKNEQHSQD